LSGAHRYLFPQVVTLLREKGAGDISVIGGGIIPEQDFQKLYDAGIKAIFVPGTTLDAIVEWVNNNIKPVERT
jgi:methylmalonyl-CoA mutase C-terminal domain/subunit